jgi:hypothetical protein
MSLYKYHTFWSTMGTEFVKTDKCVYLTTWYGKKIKYAKLRSIKNNAYYLLDVRNLYPIEYDDKIDQSAEYVYDDNGTHITTFTGRYITIGRLFKKKLYEIKYNNLIQWDHKKALKPLHKSDYLDNMDIIKLIDDKDGLDVINDNDKLLILNKDESLTLDYKLLDILISKLIELKN